MHSVLNKEVKSSTNQIIQRRKNTKKKDKMKTITIKGTVRESVGKRSSKDVRKNDAVPCVIYGGEKNIHLSAQTLDLRDLIYTNEFRKAQVEVDGVTYNAFVKDVQYHPVTDRILHVDFQELVEGKKVKTEIPVKLVGSPNGVKVGGVLVQKLRKLKVKTTPDLLSSSIEVDVTSLELGKSIRIRDVKAREGIEIMNSGGIPLASVDIPRALRSAQSQQVKEEGEEV